LCFIALKNHFNTKSYDYIKYNGKIKGNYEAYLVRTDKLYYYNLSRKDDPEKFVVANMVINSEIWIGDLMNDKAEKNFRAWQIRNSGLIYNFTKDIRFLASKENVSIRDMIKVHKGQHPLLLDYYREMKISPETLLIINDLTKMFSYWDANLDDTLIWPDISMRLTKYRPFLKLPAPPKEFAKIILDVKGKM
jgi:hypothetical protein